MKFTCTQENFDRGLSLVGRIASRNVALPILNNVLVVAEPDGVSLQTTNLELGITVSIRGKVEQPGRYTVQSRLLADFVHLLDHEKVTLTLEDGGLRVTSGHSSSLLKGLPAEDFPLMPPTEGDSSATLPSNQFRRILEGVVFAAANDESRPEISGVYILIQDSGITAAATDSYRLSERRATLLQASTKPKQAILPARAAHELLRVLPDDETVVTLVLTDNQAQISFQEVKMAFTRSWPPLLMKTINRIQQVLILMCYQTPRLLRFTLSALSQGTPSAPQIFHKVFVFLPTIHRVFLRWC